MSPLLLALLLLPVNDPPSMSRGVMFGETPQLAQSWSCVPRKTCGRINSCEEAYWYLANCNWGSRLDGDSDGVPCESICGSY